MRFKRTAGIRTGDQPSNNVLGIPMKHLHSKQILLLGFVLVLLGFLIPFLMVLKIIESSWALDFFAFGASFAGILLGVIGAAEAFG